MSGFESGAIQSIRSNQRLRRGPGQKFKESLYVRGGLPISSSTRKESSRIKQANERRKTAVKMQLFWLGVAAIFVFLQIKRMLL